MRMIEPPVQKPEKKEPDLFVGALFFLGVVVTIYGVLKLAGVA